MAAWATNRSRALSTRQSAGIMSPADSCRWSPGTRSRMGRSCAWETVLPAGTRHTVAVLLTRALSASAARLERASCTKRITVLKATMLPITTVALLSSVSQDTAANKVSSRLKGLL